jgi:hypothetical protein
MQESEFKAVEMVRSIRDAHYQTLERLTPQERIAFYREKARALHVELGKPEALLQDPTRPPAAKG